MVDAAIEAAGRQAEIRKLKGERGKCALALPSAFPDSER
jgi:hypothetical protein